MNLIGNAIKFTQSGEVILRVQRNKDAAPLLLFTVSDTGPGIASDKLEHIFDAFTQADAYITRKYGGSGLGLAISKRLVELMRGRIWVDSKPGLGSTFSFTADFGVQTEPVVSTSAPPNEISGLKALIIDDNETNRMILRETLVGWGLSVYETHSGAKGLAELARASERNSPYQLVLLDCWMPEMDGFEVAAQIRQNSKLKSPVILMLSSDLRSSDFARADQVGITHTLVKPVKRTRLFEAILNATKRIEPLVKQQIPGEQIHTSDPVLDGSSVLRILIAEDNEDNLFLIKTYLQDHPYQIDVCRKWPGGRRQGDVGAL